MDPCLFEESLGLLTVSARSLRPPILLKSAMSRARTTSSLAAAPRTNLPFILFLSNRRPLKRVLS